MSALSKIADYRLEPELQERLDELGERKEFLGPAEHQELVALAEFCQRRAIEAMEARLALRQLNDAFPTTVLVP